MEKDTQIKKLKTNAAVYLLAYSLLLLLALTGCGAKASALDAAAITVLEPADFTEYVTADGTVECAHPHFIYSTLTLPVREVLVREGDRVQPGDLLCVLDTDTIEDQIALQQAAMALTERSASTNITAARHQYDVYSEGLANGTDVNLVAAMAQIENAKSAYETAQKQYDDYKSSLNLGMDPTLVAADQAVAQASTAVQQARSMQAKLDDTDGVTDIQKEEAEDAVDSANLAYAQAIQRREDLLRQSDLLLANYAANADAAMVAYINAQVAYEAAERALENTMRLSYDAISQALLSGDLSVEELQLAQLQAKLADAQIVSDYAGTVTAVNIEVGENSTGVLFVIEDTADLTLTPRVPEKDINRIATAMEVLVTPKADDSDSYAGTVERIADSTGKNASGQTNTSGEDAEFEVTVAINAPDERIKIGMNAEAAFVIYEQAGCFSVANESLLRDANGQTYVLLVSGDGEELSVSRSEVSVVYAGKSRSVIEGSAIVSGARILTDAAAHEAE